MHKLDELFHSVNNPADYARGYLDRVAEVMRGADYAKIGQAVDWIEEACHTGRAIFCIANGGSASVASHLVNDLVPNTLVEKAPGFRAYCLADNVESVTAIANDSGFERIFELQLQALMSPGDIVLAMSCSGNSPNILRGVDYANAHGGRTMAFCGFDGGKLAKAAQLTVYFPSSRDEYGPVEDMFALMNHIITGYLTMKRGKKLHH